MKTTLMLLFAWAFLINAKAMGQDKIATQGNKETLHVYCSPDVYDLTQEWVKEYRNQHPHFTAEVRTVFHSSLVEAGLNEGEIVITTGTYKTIQGKDIENMVIGRRVMVPVISSNNPLISDLSVTGISLQAMRQLLSIAGVNKNAPVIINNKAINLNYYSIRNDFISHKVDRFLNINGAGRVSKNVENGEGLIQNLKNDPYGFGFCMLSDVIDYEKQSFFEGISLLPIDKNGNGKLDYVEKIYASPEAFLRGVWIGKYPAEFISNLYAISIITRVSPEQAAFLRWILVQGQENLGKYGYQELVSNEVASRLNRIQGLHEEKNSMVESRSDLKAILIAVGILVLIGLLIDVAIFRYNRIASKKARDYAQQIIYNEEAMVAPAGLFFDKSHTWVFMEKNGEVKIGMSDFLPSVTGKLTGVVLKKTGESIKKGETFLSLIQEGKQLNVKAPVSGTITRLNTKLIHDAGLINFSPYNEGWVYTLEPSNWLREIQFLLMFDKFKFWLKSEYLRLKDFLAMVKISEGSLQPNIILQDGGELRKSVLKDLDPKVWDDFQQHFIDEM